MHLKKLSNTEIVHLYRYYLFTETIHLKKLSNTEIVHLQILSIYNPLIETINSIRGDYNCNCHFGLIILFRCSGPHQSGDLHHLLHHHHHHHHHHPDIMSFFRSARATFCGTQKLQLLLPQLFPWFQSSIWTSYNYFCVNEMSYISQRDSLKSQLKSQFLLKLSNDFFSKSLECAFQALCIHKHLFFHAYIFTINRLPRKIG